MARSVSGSIPREHDRGHQRHRPHGRFLRVVLLLVALIVAVGVLASCGEQDAPKAGSGCAETDAPHSGTTHFSTYDRDDNRRTYLVHVPPHLRAGEKVPVVFMFHGYGGSADRAIATTGFDRLADSKKFAVVAIDGLGNPRRWALRGADHLRDVSLVKQVLTEVRRAVCVNTSRIYSAGFSNGSMFTLQLACENVVHFAAYAGVSGPYIGTCAQAPSQPILVFHGTADPTVPFGGGHTPVGNAPGYAAELAAWVRHDTCTGEPVVESIAAGVTRSTWADCAGDGTVVGYRLAGGVHHWPGATRFRPGTPRSARRVGTAINATTIIWTFFSTHSADAAAIGSD